MFTGSKGTFVIKGTNILAEIKRTQSSDKDKTGKTDAHNKEHKITKIIRTKKQKLLSNSNSTINWEYGPGTPVG